MDCERLGYGTPERKHELAFDVVGVAIILLLNDAQLVSGQPGREKRFPFGFEFPLGGWKALLRIW